MADAISATLGFGSVAGSSAAPVDIVTLTSYPKNFVTLTNFDATNWLFAKDASDPGPFKVAGPGASLTIAHGPPNGNNTRKIIGFGATPSNGGAATVVAAISADKY